MFKCDGYENDCDCPKCATKWAMKLIHEAAEASVEVDLTEEKETAPATE